MKFEDLPQVGEIERESFEYPWSVQYFCRELTSNKIASYSVVCDGPKIFGFIGLWFIVGEIHITTIAICPSHRRKGLGELLLIGAFESAIRRGARFLTLEVRQSNKAALGLYRKYGIVEVGVRKNYYSETDEDALIMTTDDITSDVFQSNFCSLKRSLNEKLRDCKWDCRDHLAHH